MKSLSILYSVFIFWLIFGSCQPQVNTPADYDSIQENWELFAESWERFDTEGCTALYFDDAVLFPPQLPVVKGKRSISEFYENLFFINRSAQYSHTTESITFLNEHAIEVGSFSVNWVSVEGDSSTYNARAMIHWEKDSFGDWKIKKLLFNNPPEEKQNE